MERQHIMADELWAMQIPVPVAKAVRVGDLVMTCGQCDLDPQGRPQRLGDLYGQTEAVIGHALAVLGRAGAEPRDLAKLVVFYVNDGTEDEDALRAHLASLLPREAAVCASFVPIPWFYYPGMMVEVDAYALTGPGETRASSPARAMALPAPLVHGVRRGETALFGQQVARGPGGALLHAGDVVAQVHAMMANVTAVLGELGCDIADLVKVNTWYAAGGSQAEWEANARARGPYFSEPGPVGTGVPLPRLWPRGLGIWMDGWAMRGTDGARLERRTMSPTEMWDWPGYHLPFSAGLECRGRLFVAGQPSMDRAGNVLDPDDMAAQTHRAMGCVETVLRRLGGGLSDLAKVNVVYRGGPNPEDLHGNLSIRSGYYARPGPASTGVPLPALAYPGMTIEIEAIGALKETSE